jgi:glycosyltransferase involved in cell wall biosynthesis
MNALPADQVSLSIVMPAHNEGRQIALVVREWLDEIVPRVPAVEMVIVDDASTDDTGTQLDRLAATVPALRVVRLTSNVGHGPATRAGLDLARGAFVFQTDSDRQHHPADFWALWTLRDQADFVFGRRRHRADGGSRVAVSTVMRVIIATLWGRWIADANCPFKLARREALGAVLAEVPRDTFIPMVMVAILARVRRYRVVEVEVRHAPRTAGESSLRGLGRWWRIGRRCVRELIALRWATWHHSPRRVDATTAS